MSTVGHFNMRPLNFTLTKNFVHISSEKLTWITVVSSADIVYSVLTVRVVMHHICSFYYRVWYLKVLPCGCVIWWLSISLFQVKLIQKNECECCAISPSRSIIFFYSTPFDHSSSDKNRLYFQVVNAILTIRNHDFTVQWSCVLEVFKFKGSRIS